MRPIFALAAAIAAVAAPAAAQDRRPITLAPEELVTLWLHESGATTARLEASHVAWTRHDLAIARYMSGLTPPKEPAQAIPLPDDASMPPAAPIQRRQLRLRFMSIAGQHSFLVLENGFDQAIVYRARMTRNGIESATDVCLIMPMRRGYEHWPHPIDRIEISDIRFVPWRQGGPVPCA